MNTQTISVDIVKETINMNMELNLMNAEDIISGKAFPFEIYIKTKVHKIKKVIYNKMLNEKISTKRKSVEFNAMEATCAILLVYRDITNYTELYNRLLYMEQNKNSYDHILKFNNTTDLSNYLDDIMDKKDIMNSFITNFNTSISKCLDLSLDNIKTIYVSGKKNKHPEITKLNAGLHKLESKSDIYIQLQNNGFIGISIKQSEDCTKSNYSVHKIFEKEVEKTLTQIKKKYLTEKGFPKFNAEDRTKVNALFYPQNKENPYMIKLKEEIENNKEKIKMFLMEKLYCVNANYPVYEFNGKSMVYLNASAINILNVEFKEWTDYYIQKNGKERCAAKLFYILIIGEKKYRVEVRWKGDCYVSPQFQIHEE